MEGQWQQELRDMKIDIVSGSLALNLYGLIERDINDIDILIDSRFRYSGYYSGQLYGSPNDGELTMENRLGYIYFEEEVKSKTNI